MGDAVEARGDADDVEVLVESAGGEEIDSVTLARLLEEVRNQDEVRPTAYNRMHNRHNRS